MGAAGALQDGVNGGSEGVHGRCEPQEGTGAVGEGGVDIGQKAIGVGGHMEINRRMKRGVNADLEGSRSAEVRCAGRSGTGREAESAAKGFAEGLPVDGVQDGVLALEGDGLAVAADANADLFPLRVLGNLVLALAPGLKGAGIGEAVLQGGLEEGLYGREVLSEHGLPEDHDGFAHGNGIKRWPEAVVVLTHCFVG